MENSINSFSSKGGYKNNETNDAFPIHANIYDSDVDKNSNIPGGYFTK
jgi:hypothetical protein